MGQTKRKRCTAEFKAKVALEALKVRTDRRQPVRTTRATSVFEKTVPPTS